MCLLNFYKSLADETRLKCLLLLQSEGELCVCDLITALEQSQPKISRHLGELRKHELVRGDRRGKWVYYQIHPQLPAGQRELLALSLKHYPALIENELLRIRHSQQQCC